MQAIQRFGQAATQYGGRRALPSIDMLRLPMSRFVVTAPAMTQVSAFSTKPKKS